MNSPPIFLESSSRTTDWLARFLSSLLMRLRISSPSSSSASRLSSALRVTHRTQALSTLNSPNRVGA